MFLVPEAPAVLADYPVDMGYRSHHLTASAKVTNITYRSPGAYQVLSVSSTFESIIPKDGIWHASGAPLIVLLSLDVYDASASILCHRSTHLPCRACSTIHHRLVTDDGQSRTPMMILRTYSQAFLSLNHTFRAKISLITVRFLIVFLVSLICKTSFLPDSSVKTTSCSTHKEGINHLAIYIFYKKAGNIQDLYFSRRKDNPAARAEWPGSGAAPHMGNPCIK